MHDPPSDNRRRERFEELFAANHDAVLGYLLRRSASGEDAADLLAETFLTAWRRLHDVPADGMARAWLYGVARRALANHRRGVRRRHALADRLRNELTNRPAVEDQAMSAETVAAFEALPDRDRELLTLIAWEGLDTAAIAVVLDCSRNAVRIRMHRARRRFERLLAIHDHPRAERLALAPAREMPND